MTRTDEQRLVEEAGKRLAECEAQVGLSPSVFVFSGRGCWGYWKLDRPVTQLEAERLMLRLFALLRREGTEWRWPYRPDAGIGEREDRAEIVRDCGPDPRIRTT